MVVVEIGSGGRNANISRVPMEVVNSYKQEKKSKGRGLKVLKLKLQAHDNVAHYKLSGTIKITV